MVSIDTEVLEMAIGVYFQDELEPRLKNKIYIPKVYSQFTSRKVGGDTRIYIPKVYSSPLLER